jgi:hypothetical protein
MEVGVNHCFLADARELNESARWNRDLVADSCHVEKDAVGVF